MASLLNKRMMKDSYQKLADDVFGQFSEKVNTIFSRVNDEDLDEIRVTFAVKILHLEYADNFRIFPLKQEKEFYQQSQRGCCGSWDTQYKCLSGNIYWLGCNYGH